MFIRKLSIFAGGKSYFRIGNNKGRCTFMFMDQVVMFFALATKSLFPDIEGISQYNQNITVNIRKLTL